jgi:hypothetical protein
MQRTPSSEAESRFDVKKFFMQSEDFFCGERAATEHMSWVN